MKNKLLVILIIAINVFCFNINFAQPANSSKKISITIDDLPFNRALDVPNGEMKLYVEKLLNKIKSNKIPVTAFVNENKLESDGKRDPERVQILKMWLDAGVELGNHTYSHKSANQISIDEYEWEILNGERTLKELLAERNLKLRYFRHPFLHTGLSLDYRNEVNKFLESHGYEVAPVTIDNSEWIYAVAYDNAVKAGNNELMKKIGSEYIEYMKMKIRYFENQTHQLFGRQINQILLIHSNRINAEYYSELCEMMRGEGYDFITLEEALKDDAYKSPDSFIKNNGISWLHRWAITRGMKRDFFKGEPEVPEHILKIAGVDSE